MKGFFCSRNLLVKRVKQYKRRNIMTQCPECEAEVTVQGLMVGEIIFCPDCNAELEVINVEQPEVALAPQIEEDWGE
jgi:alpha-aminoadipate carrier protein LysW